MRRLGVSFALFAGTAVVVHAVDRITPICDPNRVPSCWVEHGDSTGPQLVPVEPEQDDLRARVGIRSKLGQRSRNDRSRRAFHWSPGENRCSHNEAFRLSLAIRTPIGGWRWRASRNSLRAMTRRRSSSCIAPSRPTETIRKLTSGSLPFWRSSAS
jgi:hypothetical protein